MGFEKDPIKKAADMAFAAPEKVSEIGFASAEAVDSVADKTVHRVHETGWKATESIFGSAIKGMLSLIRVKK